MPNTRIAESAAVAHATPNTHTHTKDACRFHSFVPHTDRMSDAQTTLTHTNHTRKQNTHKIAVGELVNCIDFLTTYDDVTHQQDTKMCTVNPFAARKANLSVDSAREFNQRSSQLSVCLFYGSGCLVYWSRCPLVVLVVDQTPSVLPLLMSSRLVRRLVDVSVAGRKQHRAANELRPDGYIIRFTINTKFSFSAAHVHSLYVHTYTNEGLLLISKYMYLCASLRVCMRVLYSMRPLRVAFMYDGKHHTEGSLSLRCSLTKIHTQRSVCMAENQRGCLSPKSSREFTYYIDEYMHVDGVCVCLCGRVAAILSMRTENSAARIVLCACMCWWCWCW